MTIISTHAILLLIEPITGIFICFFFHQNTKVSFHEDAFEYIVYELMVILSRPQYGILYMHYKSDKSDAYQPFIKYAS